MHANRNFERDALVNLEFAWCSPLLKMLLSYKIKRGVHPSPHYYLTCVPFVSEKKDKIVLVVKHVVAT